MSVGHHSYKRGRSASVKRRLSPLSLMSMSSPLLTPRKAPSFSITVRGIHVSLCPLLFFFFSKSSFSLVSFSNRGDVLFPPSLILFGWGGGQTCPGNLSFYFLVYSPSNNQLPIYRFTIASSTPFLGLEYRYPSIGSL